MNTLRNFWNDDRSHAVQLIEHSLLLAFVAVGSSAIFLQAKNHAPQTAGTSSAQLLLRARIAGE